MAVGGLYHDPPRRVPLVKRLAIKLDAVDYPSKRRINTKPIPRMGGTAVFLGLVVA